MPQVVDPDKEERQKLEYFEKNKTKYSFAFNVTKMSKEEIVARFDKHAPNWFVQLCALRLISQETICNAF